MNLRQNFSIFRLKTINQEVKQTKIIKISAIYGRHRLKDILSKDKTANWFRIAENEVSEKEEKRS